ncbi:hypothetical protein IJJ37_00215 [Candidatus Saccharibacteria bacterium]|nr:hypothetical protein [Candidatus Saccharibacteria bacterium]
MAKEIKLPSIKELIEKRKKSMPSRPTHPEINLVPDVKNEMIKALKLRNLIFFLCIVISAASFAVGLIFTSIAAGQQAAVDGKKSTLDELSKKVNSYSDLSDFLTIRDQLGNLSSITKNKKLLSRTFSVLSALIPTGADTITISELSINLSNESPTLSFDAQANAGQEPYIDYNVLDSFKKSMQYMRYDYGTYVDKEGAEIPAYCMIENGTNGATLIDTEKGYFAYWLITGEGCHPSYEEEEALSDASSATAGTDATAGTGTGVLSAEEKKLAAMTAGYATETYNGNTVVKIWRTPQFKDWYKENPKENEPQMSLDGVIENVAHFNSSCMTYEGIEDEKGNVTWKTSNDACLLVPDGTDGIKISDSSNGRGAGDELVLRFSATITVNPEVYSFTNKHVIAMAPSGRYNVTDSYVQIQNMFGERAADCAANDTACNGGN